VGIGVGVGVGVPILVAIALIPWCLRRRRKKADVRTTDTGSRIAEMAARSSGLNARDQEKFGYAQLSELNAQAVVYEMGSGR
jgi:hypothetical protein